MKQIIEIFKPLLNIFYILKADDQFVDIFKLFITLYCCWVFCFLYTKYLLPPEDFRELMNSIGIKLTLKK